MSQKPSNGQGKLNLILKLIMIFKFIFLILILDMNNKSFQYKNVILNIFYLNCNKNNNLGLIKVRTNKLKITLLFSGILLLVFINGNNFRNNLLTNDIAYNNNESDLKRAGYWEISPIYIDDTDPSYNWSITAATYDWCSGNGTWSNPYIIENVTIDGGGSGNCITIRNSAVFFIINNLTVYNSLLWGDRGIYLYNVNNSWLSKNTVYNNFRGIELENSNNNTLSGNTANSNEDTGIYLKNSNNNTLSNNAANFIIGRGRQNGIILDNSNNNTVWQNTASNNDVHGISFQTNSDNNIVWNNTVRYNDQAGISLGESDYNTIELNNATKNYMLGIFLSESSNNDFLRNELNNNYGMGMALSDSKNNTISGNTIKNNDGIGINLYDTRNENNIITDNYISDNSAYGVQLDGRVKNNLVYNNVFDGGGSTYAVDNSYDINYWDNGTIGNYYSDYGGVDADDDYVGDTPYSIGGTAGAVDNYPIWDDGYSGTPILIDDAGAQNWIWARSKIWCSGSGIYDDPYIIENITIDAEYSGSCIEIKNSNVYFIIRNCTVYHSGTHYEDAAIKLYNTFNGVITHNNCSNNLNDGIRLSGGENNTISMNIITNNGHRGIGIYGANNSISKNIIFGHGILIGGGGDNNIFSENNISGIYGTHGENIFAQSSYNNNYSSNYFNLRVVMMGSSGNILWNNTLTDNSQIFLEGDLNLVYQNYFRDTSSGLDDGMLNKWDNGTIGNYWWDYSGKDANDDDIGDTPYDISGSAGNQDNYPIWWDCPVININSPNTNDIFDNNPGFDISIDDGIVDTTWYTLDDGITNITFSGLNGTIDPGEWNKKMDGPVSIIFSVNDSRGYISSRSVIVIKDVFKPSITINTPNPIDLFGSNAPNYDLTVIEDNLDSIWYTLDGGFTNSTPVSASGTIDQVMWNALPNGTVIIQFYANDTLGKLNYEEVLVRKDIIEPTLIINSPNSNNLFGLISPEYNLTVTDTNLDSIWFTLNGGLTNSTPVSASGTIDQVMWNALPNGTVIIQFYANDTAGNLNYEEVIIWKDIIEPSITINSPNHNDLYGSLAPDFDVTVSDSNGISAQWYTIDGGITNYTFVGSIGVVNQTAWGLQSNGTVLIRFYANDSIGNAGYLEIIVRKDILAPIIYNY